MRIEIRIERGAVRRWHQTLAARLGTLEPANDVCLSLLDAPSEPRAGAVAALLALERVVLRRSRDTLCDRLPDADLPPPPPGFEAEAVVDLTRSGAPLGPRGAAPRLQLRPLFNGSPGEDILVAFLIGRTMPGIAIEDAASGRILASGQPSGESADGLTGGIEAVVSRVILLIERVLTGPADAAAGAEAVAQAPAGAADLAKFALRNLAMNLARAVFHLCLYSPHWRIGWRFNDGPGVFERGDLGGPRWHVLRDPGHRFFADPFPIARGGRRFVFFEDLDHRLGKGVISAIEFGENGPCGPVVQVLEEPWHLSYPFMIEHEGSLWMVPESSLSKAVPIYRCLEFPHRWERAGTLLDGIEAGDCTLFRHAGRFWMMSATREGIGGYSDTLRIHHATDLFGPWEEHRRRPVLIDVAAARPAGAVFERGGRLYRPIQDCSLGYGRALRLARIDRLDEQDYAQTLVARLTPGPSWPGKRLHTLNRAAGIECIDGSSYNPRLGVLRGFAEARQEPAADRVALADLEAAAG